MYMEWGVYIYIYIYMCMCLEGKSGVCAAAIKGRVFYTLNETTLKQFERFAFLIK